MNLPQGYKQTELGIIPEDWEVRKICDGIADVKSGKRLPYGYYVTENRTNHPYIRVIDMREGGIDTSNLMYVPNEAYKPIEKYRIFKDDIFISVAGTLGIVGKIPEWLDGANLTENANRLTSITCNRDYLLYYLRSPYIQDVISSEQTIGAQPKLALTRIRNFDIALPSKISEQKAIAEALSDVDELITALDKKIAKKRLIKQGAMQELLTGKKRLPGFTEEWVEKKLGNIGYTYSGLTGKTKNDFGQGNAKYITFLNVLTNPILKDDLFESVVVNDNEHQNEVQYGDLFFNTSSETPEDVGTCAVILSRQENLYLNSFCFGYRLVDDNVLGLYLAYYFRSNCGRQLMTSLAQGATRYNLSKDLFNSSYITIPKSKDEQQAIATILSDMDKEIADLEAQREKYRLVKSGMMQKLLTGEIRLKKE